MASSGPNAAPVPLSALPLIAYLPDYLSEEAESRLLRECLASRAKWLQLSGRRVANYGGHVHDKGLIPVKMPTWLGPLLEDLGTRPYPAEPANDTLLFGDQPPNHVLVNSYRPGEGILSHQDGPAYHPVACIVSLAAPAVIRFRRKPTADTAPSLPLGPDMLSLLLMPRSLLTFAESAYTEYLHGIDEVSEEVLDETVANLEHHREFRHGDVMPRGGERVSLTVRRVAKVLPNLFKLR